MMKNGRERLPAVSARPKHEKLPWPGLKAKDRLSRVVARAIKEAREITETEIWAQNQIARILAYVTPKTAMRLVLREARRREKSIPKIAKASPKCRT